MYLPIRFKNSLIEERQKGKGRMYLSDRDLKWAIETGKLIVDPRPTEFGATSLDLHLDNVREAKIWDVAKYREHELGSGRPRLELFIGKYRLSEFSKNYLDTPPDYTEDESQLVGKRGSDIVIKRGGFLATTSSVCVIGRSASTAAMTSGSVISSNASGSVSMSDRT